MKNTALLIAALFALLPIADANAEIKLSSLFGNHMVLQQEKPIRIFGTAAAGEKVTAEFGGQVANATADDKGSFQVELPAMKADGKAHTLTVSGSNKITFTDVWLGEVWLCSGQSNMEWSVQASNNAKEEIAAANHPMIRVFNVGGHVRGPNSTDDPRGTWAVCSPTSIPRFTAVGYYFGRKLQKELGVPVGLVGTNWGGTRIEPWTPKVGFKSVPNLKDYTANLESIDPASKAGKARHEKYLADMEKWLAKARAELENGKGINAPPRISLEPKSGATWIYNGMVTPLIPLSVRGAIWYQGESNAGDGLRYEYLKEALVNGWRNVFQNDDMSFYWVQLANFQQPSDKPAGGGWGPVREGQRRAMRVPKTGMAVIIDIGAAGDIHPRNKQDVGARLALWALAKDYGQDIVHSGPLYKSMTVSDNKIELSFDHVGGGLMTGKKEGMKPVVETKDQELGEFAIQSGDNTWHWASAKIEGDKVVVWADGVDDPKNVRFAYQSNPTKFNFYNKAGLPASPFTTEK